MIAILVSRRTLLALLGAAVIAGLAALAMLTLVERPAGAATGDIERVSIDSLGVEADGNSSRPAINGDGRFVAFHSSATNLVTGDTNGAADIFVRDRENGETERVSIDSFGSQSDDKSGGAAISGDGRFVAFDSFATNLVPGDTNGAADVFVHDRKTGETQRVSVDSLGGEADDLSFNPSISGDGRLVAFDSRATDLVDGDTNGLRDVFVHDRQTGKTERVSVDSLGGQSDGIGRNPSISSDGRFVAFRSTATDLVDGDTNGSLDVFVHDRETGQTSRVSVDSAGGEANADSFAPAISGDGRVVAFGSNATDLVPGVAKSGSDVYVHDRDTGKTSRVNVDNLGVEADDNSGFAGISDDGRFVTFLSEGANLVPGDTNGAEDIFLHDRQTGQTSRVSVDSLGSQADEDSDGPAISGDGRFVAFDSAAANLVPGDNNDRGDVFVHDRGLALLQGDNDCDNDADSVDALKGLQHVAAIAFNQQPECATLGDALPAAQPAGDPPGLFGDVDCDNDVDSVDALKILRSVAALSVTQNEPCTDIGEPL